ncbi:MAG: hypothetical protein A3I77_02620 [Gammaproteobacteria bacterium RIFCSPLOWO2_02_FULL_42_14]|nr:MAG: hypothetical protein A3B71_02460 [Gammaproteobacteria bacterium RIFCSPHIGHO2_02_FULL_42_43]OGT53545.1 MAG: hypothetical protein A3E54_02485 [Gammaproteobacteria bacterium RIFCSPHIGHO2_12_FULL_41_25]OGT61489.1 MAG: hypothetical protein A3I77_02620 [Gammaproteobacteria bacterium RIFCSPLOWO2_02_FULL_42_14]OGT86743.1 MAG: hypothetical protein A3G86_05260 [Gammaproteobacteria bacterium RIFCSPLOWO2_12_FULL_42_18]
MLDPKNIGDVIRNIIDAMPDGLKNIPNDTQQHLKSALQTVFERMDFVTREEFDAQCKVLQRTREKLETYINLSREPRA